MASFAESLEARCQVENEDVVGAAPTGDAPTTSEWSTILLATKVCLILDVYGSQYFAHCMFQHIPFKVTFHIVIEISHKFVPKGPTDNKSALV